MRRRPAPDGSRNFNPRTPVGCDVDAVGGRSQTILFQSTHPSGVRRLDYRLINRCIVISIHAPQWGATNSIPGSKAIDVFQSTHPSGVRRDAQCSCLLSGVISIHAPQWGATSSSPSGSSCPCNFNPRTPVGCDMGHRLTISPDWGFQSTHPSGVRLSDSTAKSTANLFQSTHPSGVRRTPPAPARAAWGYFNPRTPVGCDHGVELLQRDVVISIHAPQWGAT